MAYVNLIATEIVFNIRASGSHVGLLMAFSEHRRWIISVFDRRSIMNRLYWHNQITSRWDTFVLFHLYGNKGVSLPLWPIRPRWFHTFSPCAEPLGDGHEGMGARFGSQGSIALNWHSRYSGKRYSGTWLYQVQVLYLTPTLIYVPRAVECGAFTGDGLTKYIQTDTNE